MKTLWKKIFIISVVLLALASLMGCPQPDEGTDAAKKAQKAADAFKTDHAVILAKQAGDITLSDKDAVDLALTAYNFLSTDAKALLTAEFAKLESFRSKINELQGEVDSAVLEFKTTHAEILSKTTETVTLSDEAGLTAALNALNSYNETVKLLLAAEKVLLLELQTEIERQKEGASPQELANAFKTGHAAALALSIYTVEISDEGIVTAALAAYEDLPENVKPLLTSELSKLNSLKDTIDGKKEDAQAVIDANAFKTSHSAALAFTVSTIAIGDEYLVTAALSAYEGLSAKAKANLSSEKTLLDNLTGKINSLKASPTERVFFWNLNGSSEVPIVRSDPKYGQFDTASVMKAENGILKLDANNSLWTSGFAQQNLMNYFWQFDFRYGDADYEWSNANFVLRGDMDGGDNVKVVLSILGHSVYNHAPYEPGDQNNPGGGALGRNIQLYTASYHPEEFVLKASANIQQVYSSWYTFRIIVEGNDYKVWVWPRGSEMPSQPALTAEIKFRSSGDVCFWTYSGGMKYLDNIVLYNGIDMTAIEEDLDTLEFRNPATLLYDIDFNDGVAPFTLHSDNGDPSYMTVSSGVLKMQSNSPSNGAFRTLGWPGWTPSFGDYLMQFDFLYGTNPWSNFTFSLRVSPDGGWDRVNMTIIGENNRTSEPNPPNENNPGWAGGKKENLVLWTTRTGGDDVAYCDSIHMPELASNDWYTFRVVVVGTNYKVYVWKKGTAVPQSPALDAVITGHRALTDFNPYGNISFSMWGGSEKQLDNLKIYDGPYVPELD